MTGALDVVRFVGGPAESDAAWDGPWPPPEEFLYYVGRTTRRSGFTTAEVLEREGVSLAALHLFAEVTAYRLVEWSRLPPLEPEHHLARAARYEVAP